MKEWELGGADGWRWNDRGRRKSNVLYDYSVQWRRATHFVLEQTRDRSMEREGMGTYK